MEVFSKTPLDILGMIWNEKVKLEKLDNAEYLTRKNAQLIFEELNKHSRFNTMEQKEEYEDKKYNEFLEMYGEDAEFGFYPFEEWFEDQKKEEGYQERIWQMGSFNVFLRHACKIYSTGVPDPPTDSKDTLDNIKNERLCWKQEIIEKKEENIDAYQQGTSNFRLFQHLLMKKMILVIGGVLME